MKGVRLNLCRGGVICVALALALVFANCSSSTGGGGGGDSDKKPGNVGGPTGGDGSENPSISDYINTKYANLFTEVRSSQAQWKMGNSHDPKLFLDDNGTYYVYSTDASCGNIENTGLNIRYSTDLVNWTTLSKSAIQGYWDEDFLAWQGMSASGSEVTHGNPSYSAVTWAPTVIKQNGLYYMYHGVSTDVVMDGKKFATSSIVLAIASNAKGPFYPASYISQGKITNSDAQAIKSKLDSLGVSYKQNFLVRYCPYNYGNKGANDSNNGASIPYSSYSSSSNGAKLDSKSIKTPNYSQCNNSRYGSIDPEFVYDVSTGQLKEYTIGTNTCYAVTYGSWLSGIVVAYVDAVSLKPVALGTFSVDGKSYSKGDELDFSLDHAACGNVTEAITGHANISTADRFLLLGVPIIGGSWSGSSDNPNNTKATAYEGAQLFYHNNNYYIITSCGALRWEYRCGVGRSSDIYGPYLDAGGVDMWLGADSSSKYAQYHAIGSKIIGSHVLQDEYSMRSQGGLSVLRGKGGNIYFANHTRTNYLPEYHFALQIHQMFFNADGWPVLNQNDYNKESLAKLTEADVIGTYDTILTVRGTTSVNIKSLGLDISGLDANDFDVSNNLKFNKEDAEPTTSKEIVLGAGGSISGSYNGNWSLANDGYSITINLTGLGMFKGYILKATDWARKSGDRRTVTFTTLCSDSTATKKGEYFWGNMRGASQWTTSADGNTLSFSADEDTKSAAIPRFAVTADNGFTVEFKINDTLANHGDNDWTTKLLSYKGCYVTIPNLDPYNNTISGSNLTEKNANANGTGNGVVSGKGAVLSNGNVYTFAWGGQCTIKITFTKNAIKWYKNGTLALTYSEGLWGSGSMAEFIGYYITGLNAGEVTFNEAGMNITNLTISKGTN